MMNFFLVERWVLLSEPVLLLLLMKVCHRIETRPGLAVADYYRHLLANYHLKAVLEEAQE